MKANIVFFFLLVSCCCQIGAIPLETMPTAFQAGDVYFAATFYPDLSLVGQGQTRTSLFRFTQEEQELEELFVLPEQSQQTWSLRFGAAGLFLGNSQNLYLLPSAHGTISKIADVGALDIEILDNGNPLVAHFSRLQEVDWQSGEVKTFANLGATIRGVSRMANGDFVVGTDFSALHEDANMFFLDPAGNILQQKTVAGGVGLVRALSDGSVVFVSDQRSHLSILKEGAIQVLLEASKKVFQADGLATSFFQGQQQILNTTRGRPASLQQVTRLDEILQVHSLDRDAFCFTKAFLSPSGIDMVEDGEFATPACVPETGNLYLLLLAILAFLFKPLR